MNNEVFDFDMFDNFYTNGQLKDHLDAKNYLEKFFYPLTNGSTAILKNGEFEMINSNDFNSVYLARFPKDISVWYKTKTRPREIIVDPHKDRIGKSYINMFPKSKFETYEKYETLDKDIKKKVDKMISYIKLIWASNNEEILQYLLCWFSNVIKKKKNSSCIIAKSNEGCGKSTLTKFFSDHCIGDKLSCKGKADHLKGCHNLQLLGKTFVCFEELQTFSDREWAAIDSEIKDMITDNKGSYTDKYEKRIEAENYSNYIVNTNFNAIKSSQGRRYFVSDINPEKMDDFEYFEDLRKTCFNDKVGYAFSCYLNDINTDDFNSLKFPMTKNKADLCAALLSPIEKFLKDTFYLKKTGINSKPKDLQDSYNMWLIENNMRECKSIQKFCISMRELSLDYSSEHGKNNIYKITYDKLKIVATKRKWSHELDEFEGNEPEPTNHNMDEIEVEELKLYKSENKNLKKQIEALKQELELLKNQIKPEPIKEEVKVVKETKTKTKVKEVKPIKKSKKEVEITREEIDNMVDNFF